MFNPIAVRIAKILVSFAHYIAIGLEFEEQSDCSIHFVNCIYIQCVCALEYSCFKFVIRKISKGIYIETTRLSR